MPGFSKSPDSSLVLTDLEVTRSLSSPNLVAFVPVLSTATWKNTQASSGQREKLPTCRRTCERQELGWCGQVWAALLGRARGGTGVPKPFLRVEKDQQKVGGRGRVPMARTQVRKG